MEINKPKPVNLMAIVLPSLVGIYAVLNFLETNARSLEFSDILSLIIVVTLSGAILISLLRITGFNLNKSSLLATLLLSYCLYGNVIFLVFQRIAKIELPYLLFSCIMIMFFAFIVFLFYRTKANFTLTVQILTTFVIFGIIVATSNFLLYDFNRLKTLKVKTDTTILEGEKIVSPNARRNIFYIILDRYANQRTLTAEYDFDNSEFTNMLRNNGFFVANNSASNYPFTAQSLSSSLNMVYHQFGYDQTVSNSDDMVPFYRLLKHNSVAAFLKEQGYKYVHMGSWWMPSESSPQADENFQTTFFGRVAYSFLHRSVLEPLLYLFNSSQAKQSIDPNQCDRIPRKIQRLRELASTDTPTFVFSHFLIPHDPFVFDKNGRCKEVKETISKNLKENYLSQLQYANRFVTELVETLLSRPGPKPIIIIQADEGPYPLRYRQDENAFQWKNATEIEMQQKMRILNAYYFPEADSSIFYNTITPVNSFRLLFNTYFYTNLALLPDQNFAIPNNSNKYGFFDVTDIVR